MQLLKSLKYKFLLLSTFWKCTLNFKGAPGSLTLKIQKPQYVDDCNHKDCKYNLEICVGSGRGENERCLWSPLKSYSNYLQNIEKYLANITFEVDDVQSTFFFNANLTYYQGEKIVKVELFNDNLFRYSQIQSLYSIEFTTLTIDMFIKCKPGFYPKNKCTVSCFDGLPAYKCDEEGNKICLTGYIFENVTSQCNVNRCLTETTVCQNNGTCINDVQGTKCQCSANFSGHSCEIWNPCINHKCQNGAKCVKLEAKKDYICQCADNYYGRYCENVERSCLFLKCNTNFKCHMIENEPECIAIKIKPVIPLSTIPNMISKAKMRLPIIKETRKEEVLNNQVEKETVKQIQYPTFRSEYTTFAIIIVLIVFMIGCFGVAFWVLKIKYFQKKNKSYSNYPTLPVMPSIFNTSSSYKSGEENFKRWHSLDDNSFYFCNHSQTEPYHTYRSGSHVWPKQDQAIDPCHDNYPSLSPSYRMCHSMTRAPMPMLREPSTINSSEINFNAANTSQNNSEKIEDFNNNYIAVCDPVAIDV